MLEPVSKILGQGYGFIKDPNDNDSVTSDPSRISNVLNDHFASVGPKLANKLQTV